MSLQYRYSTHHSVFAMVSNECFEKFFANVIYKIYNIKPYIGYFFNFAKLLVISEISMCSWCHEYIENRCNCTPLHFLENVKLSYLYYKYFKKKVNHTKKRKKIRVLVYFLACPKNFLVVFTGGGKKCLRTRIKCFLVHFLLSQKRKYIYFLLISTPSLRCFLISNLLSSKITYACQSHTS